MTESSTLEAINNTTGTISTSNGTGEVIPGGILAIANSSLKGPRARTETEDDSCLWHNDETCHRPRSCRACLNVNLGDTKCMVNPIGACVRAEPMSSTQKVRSARFDSSRDNYYRSGYFKYCSLDDIICKDWKNRWQVPSSSGDTKGYYLDYHGRWHQGNSLSNTASDTNMPSYVVGEDGKCLCIQACEQDDWQVNVISSECKEGLEVNFTFTVIVMLGLSFVTISLICTIIMLFRNLYSCRPMNNSGRIFNQSYGHVNTWYRQTTRMENRENKSQLLDLGGWKSHQEKIAEDERAQVARGREDALSSRTAPATSILVKEETKYSTAEYNELPEAVHDVDTSAEVLYQRV